MRAIRPLSAAIVAIALLLGPGATGAAPATIRVAVRTRGALTPDVARALASFGDVRHKMWALGIVDMAVAPADLGRLAASSLVQSVEADDTVAPAPIDLVPASDFAGGVTSWDLDMINVTDTGVGRVVPYDGEGVYVAVIDMGLVPEWREFLPEDRIAAGLGTAFIGGANERSPWDDKGHAANPSQLWDNAVSSHGTHVTSTILGYFVSTYDVAVNGVAPRATVIPINVFGPDGFGSNLDIVAALYYVAWLRASGTVPAPIVVNMSLGTHRPASSLESAIDYAIAQGVVVIAAAGNSDGLGMAWPGAYPQVISAGATGWRQAWLPLGPGGEPNIFFTINDVPEEVDASSESYVASFSSRENPGLGFPQQLDVMAPGDYILGPWFARHGRPQSPKRFPYVYASGTSMAAPHVSGVAALVLQKDPALTQSDVAAILQASALPVAPGSYVDPTTVLETSWGSGAADQGAGLIQADAALGLTP
jgi:subtilisin family serine protease